MDNIKADAVVDVYQPPDNELNLWMYAMIGVGCAFVVFVIASIYLMCNSPTGNQPQPLRRHPSSVPTKSMRQDRDHL